MRATCEWRFNGSMSGIFLSHASADRALADLLSNTLVLGGVPEKRIFLTRPICLMELGGAWTLGTPTFPIVVPPLTRAIVRERIGSVQMSALDTDGDVDELFDELHDRVANDVSIVTETSSWNRAARSFKIQLTTLAARSAHASQESRERGAAEGLTRLPESLRNAANSTDRITISNVALGPRGDELFGEVTNSDDVGHTVYLNAIFYSVEGTIMGTNTVAVSQLRPGDTKTFRVSRVPAHARHKIEIRLIGTY